MLGKRADAGGGYCQFLNLLSAIPRAPKCAESLTRPDSKKSKVGREWKEDCEVIAGRTSTSSDRNQQDIE